MPHLLNATKCAECTFRSLLFDKLSTEELEILDKSKNELQFNKGEVIVQEGQEIKEFLYVSKGLVKLSKRSDNKKDHIISISRPRAFIGFLTVFSQKNYQYSITAISDSTLCFIDINLIKSIIANNGVFALDVLSKMSKLSDEIIYNRVNICAKNLRGRIAFLLLYLSKEIFHDTQFVLPITRREVGELIDVSTENVIRIMSEFRKDGIMGINGCKVEIVNFQALTNISRFG